MYNSSKHFPSRSCLLTGVYAQYNGLFVNPYKFKELVGLYDQWFLENKEINSNPEIHPEPKNKNNKKK
jgi:hypothetical protein